MATGVQARPRSARWTLIGVIIVQLLGASPARSQTTSTTISNDISKGTELLRSKDIMQRVGGIYLLGKAATQSYVLSGPAKDKNGKGAIR